MKTMKMPGDLLKMFDEIQGRNYGTRFYKADLHFHTPASSDGRGRDKYGFNPYGISYPARKKIANADLLADLKGLNELGPLQNREDIKKLELEVLEVLENKILHDMDLLENIKTLKALKGSGNHSELEAKVLQGIKDINDLKNLKDIDLKFLERDEIKALIALSSQENLALLPALKDIEIKMLNELESNLFDLRVLRDLKQLRRQVPGEGYPKSVRGFKDKILLYSKIKAQQIVETFLAKRLSIVAVTDHNGIGTLWNDYGNDDEDDKGKDDLYEMDLTAPTWYELIDDAARRANKKGARLLILPGVEISTTGVHILAIFKPQQPRRTVHFMICDLLSEVGIPPAEWCMNSAVGTLSPYDTINLIVKKGGIAIPAHIDGNDQALLTQYKLQSGAVKDVVGNPQLRAVEVLNPNRFRAGKTKAQLDEVRRSRNLPSLAYFQGSDSHHLGDVAKRSTDLKMTKPSFEGLETAIKIPSSRVRFTDDQKEWDGLFIRGMVFDHPALGQQTLRFNRNLNCISGKVGVGKTTLHDLMRAAVDPTCPYPKSKANDDSNLSQSYAVLFVEKIEANAPPEHFAYYRKAKPKLLGPVVSVYSLGQDGKHPKESKLDPSLQPSFYNTETIKQIVDIEAELDKFICENFKIPPKDLKDKKAASIQAFNKLFSLPRFLDEENKGQLLELVWDDMTSRFQLKTNMQWRIRNAEMKKFSSLSISQRKTAIMCMSIRNEQFGPVIIDAPEQEFDNEDMTKYLVPLILQFKDTRQILLFTNHPILAVNTDPDNYLLLELQDSKKKGAKPELKISSGFAIDATHGEKDLLLNILEGDLEMFRKRASRYG
jgi:hypothetical protein